MRYLNYDARVLECPSGVTERSTLPPYRFSYSVNNKFTGRCIAGAFSAWAGSTTLQAAAVRGAVDKLLAIEEDVTAINDGQWCADEHRGRPPRRTSLSVIHDKGREYGGGNRWTRYTTSAAAAMWSLPTGTVISWSASDS